MTNRQIANLLESVGSAVGKLPHGVRVLGVRDDFMSHGTCAVHVDRIDLVPGEVTATEKHGNSNLSVHKVFANASFFALVSPDELAFVYANQTNSEQLAAV